MNNKEKKVLYMFDEIGKIDDKFVNEAISCEKAVPVRNKFIKILALAATLALIASLCLIAIADFAASDEPGADGNADHYEDGDTDNDGTAPDSDTDTDFDPIQSDLLALAMTDLSASLLETAKIYGSPSEILYDENARLIWTYGNGVFYSIKVDLSDLETLKTYLEKDDPVNVDPSEEYGDFRFYISYGNGKVETPYLENNPGRISFGTLSNYLPEVYPSSDFADFISFLIEHAEN